MKNATSIWKVQFTSELAEMSADSGRIHCWSERREGGSKGMGGNGVARLAYRVFFSRIVETWHSAESRSLMRHALPLVFKATHGRYEISWIAQDRYISVFNSNLTFISDPESTNSDIGKNRNYLINIEFRLLSIFFDRQFQEINSSCDFWKMLKTGFHDMKKCDKFCIGINAERCFIK